MSIPTWHPSAYAKDGIITTASIPGHSSHYTISFYTYKFKMIMKHLLYTLLRSVSYLLLSKNRFGRISHYAQNGNKQCSIPDTVVMASITRTWFSIQTRSLMSIPHAHVELYINNQYIETMQWKTLNNPLNPDQPDTLFLSNTILAEGDRIKLLHPPLNMAGSNGRRYHTKESTHKTPVIQKKVTEFIKEQFPTILKYTYEVTFDELPKRRIHYLGQNHTNKTGYYGYYETEIDYILIQALRNRMPYWRKYGIQRDWKRRSPSTDQSINGQTHTLYKTKRQRQS